MFLCTAGAALCKGLGLPGAGCPKQWWTQGASAVCRARGGSLAAWVPPWGWQGCAGMLCRECLAFSFCLSNASPWHSCRDSAGLEGALGRALGRDSGSVCGVPAQSGTGAQGGLQCSGMCPAPARSASLGAPTALQNHCSRTGGPGVPLPPQQDSMGLTHSGLVWQIPCRVTPQLWQKKNS